MIASGFFEGGFKNVVIYEGDEVGREALAAVTKVYKDWRSKDAAFAAEDKARREMWQVGFITMIAEHACDYHVLFFTCCTEKADYGLRNGDARTIPPELRKSLCSSSPYFTCSLYRFHPPHHRPMYRQLSQRPCFTLNSLNP
jgi:hypothetical protein